MIIGGGFAGLQAALRLSHSSAEVLLIDRQNHHLFQPLLYQVATAGLPPQDIAMPIRAAVSQQKNTRVLLAEVVGAELDKKVITLADGRRIDFDYLVLAAGATPSYFGHDEWAEFATSLKDLRHATRIRERVLMAFEAAEQEEDPAKRRELLTFVVIGGGPTGVELAGSLSELGRLAMARDFRRVKANDIRVVLVEMADRVLTPFDPRLSAKAQRMLQELQVELRLGTSVTRLSEDGVYLGGAFIPAGNICWAAGVKPEPIAAQMGLPLDRRGAVRVEADCSVAGHPNVFAIGDIACFVPDGAERPLPGLAPVAIQQGRYVGKLIAHELRGQRRKPFRYLDKGIMATIGRSRAVAQAGPLRLSGLIAWLAWMFVHVWYLNGFRSRTVVLFNWFWSYITFKSGARLILDTYASADLKALPHSPARPTVEGASQPVAPMELAPPP